eukprot:jgi/Mesen1/5607/ME000282S04753
MLSSTLKSSALLRSCLRRCHVANFSHMPRAPDLLSASASDLQILRPVLQREDPPPFSARSSTSAPSHRPPVSSQACTYTTGVTRPGHGGLPGVAADARLVSHGSHHSSPSDAEDQTVRLHREPSMHQLQQGQSVGVLAGQRARQQESRARWHRKPPECASLLSSKGARWQQTRGFLGVGDGDEESGLSMHHSESLIIGYSPTQLYDVVAAVDLYQDFVPWCQKSKVLWQRGDRMDAELEVGFRFLTERYVSHVHMKKAQFVKTTVSQSTLFDYLDNLWEFWPGPTPNACKLHFSVDFQFRSALYRKVAHLFFDEVVQRMVTSFEKRCLVVYGPSKYHKEQQQQQQQVKGKQKEHAHPLQRPIPAR